MSKQPLDYPYVVSLTDEVCERLVEAIPMDVIVRYEGNAWAITNMIAQAAKIGYEMGRKEGAPKADAPEPARPDLAAIYRARVFDYDSPEPGTVVKMVVSTANGVMFKRLDDDRWVATPESGGDGNVFTWHRINGNHMDGAVLVEVPQ